jgi:hypothetical protein
LRARRRCAHSRTASSPHCALRALRSRARRLPQASAHAAVTLWLKPTDIAGARYVGVEDVDLQQTVSKFIARWMAQAKLDVDPSRVTLRLVACGTRKPSAAEEAAAAELDDPRLTLAEAGVLHGCSLLAFVAGALGAVRPRASRGCAH